MAKKKTKRSKYDDNFRREAVRLVETRGDRSVEDVAHSLGVSSSMLQRWKKKFGSEDGGGGERSTQSDVAAELKALRKRVRELEMERDILKNHREGYAITCGNRNSRRQNGSVAPEQEERPLASWWPIPDKKRGPGIVADLRLVTPTRDPV